MKINSRLFTFSASLLLFASVQAQNPIVQTCYTTDPAPMVHGDRLYVYTGHDEARADFFWMQEWRIYSTTDMVNWRDHGSPLAIESFSWADDRAWAPQCVARNGKFYLYVPVHSKLTGAMAIGVAVSDSPTGPFRDAIGKPLADGSWDYIDPTVLIDDDGRAYIYWGNPRPYYAELNADMISLKTEIKSFELTEKAFGGPAIRDREKGKTYQDAYVEGPWVSKRNGKYYMIYAGGGIPEHISYAMAKGPLGPWEYKGVIMPTQETNSFTNHAGVVDYKGNSYFFYHTGWLKGGGGFARSVSVEQFQYRADGTIPTINATREGVKPVGTLNPYVRQEAETMAWGEGIETEPLGLNNVYVSNVHNGDYIKVREVDFGTSAPQRFTITAASALRGGTIEVHADSVKGALIASIPVGHTGGWETFQTLEADTKQPITGVHDIYLTFSGRKGPKLFNLDWWQFFQRKE
jgi:hypothetical protein